MEKLQEKSKGDQAVMNYTLILPHPPGTLRANGHDGAHISWCLPPLKALSFLHSFCQAGTVTQDPAMQCKHLEFLILFFLVLSSFLQLLCSSRSSLRRREQSRIGCPTAGNLQSASLWVGCEPRSHCGEAASFLGCLRAPVVVINYLSMLWFEFTKPLN